MGNGDNSDSKTDASGSGSRASLQKKRSSVFARARMSFARADGERGASPTMLRGNHGADFEDYALVQRGDQVGAGVTCGCFCPSEKVMLVMIKGPFCFVFQNKSSLSPMYAISLAFLTPKVRPESLGKTAVALETSLGDVDFVFTFDTGETKQLAEEFCAVVTREASGGEADVVRKRLGHEQLLTKRSSIRYAESIALKKVKDQPEKPVSAEDIMTEVRMHQIQET